MNKSYDDNAFFSELDKTTDLLKVFRPRIGEEAPIDMDILPSDSKDDLNLSHEVSLLNKEPVTSNEPMNKVDVVTTKLSVDPTEPKELPKQEKIKKNIKNEKNKYMFSKLEWFFCLLSLVFIVWSLIYLI